MKSTILVIEDDFDTLYPLSELLKLRGHSVFGATDAETGLRLVWQNRPDLIIADVALPGQSGLSLIAKVRSDPAVSTTPIIVISGCGPAVLVEAEAAGADVCLEKPINVELFWEAVGLFTRASPSSHPADEPLDPAQKNAAEIDRLVEELRSASSKDEREAYLRRLKARILGIEGKAKGLC